MEKLSHFDDEGRARMVDVSDKLSTVREAVADASVVMKEETLKLIADKKISKGDVFAVARIAGIMASKKCSELIPLCHPITLTSVEINFFIHHDKQRIDIEARAKSSSQTGVEMEALTAVSATALTIYDMCKAVDKAMVITDIMLREKKGGKSGHWRRES